MGNKITRLNSQIESAYQNKDFNKINNIFEEYYKKYNSDRDAFYMEYKKFERSLVLDGKIGELWLNNIKEYAIPIRIETYKKRNNWFSRNQTIELLLFDLMICQILSNSIIIDLYKYLESFYYSDRHTTPIAFNFYSTSVGCINSFLNCFINQSFKSYSTNKTITIENIINVIDKLWGDNPDMFQYVDPQLSQNALFYACQYDSLELIDYLIKKGCDPNHKNSLGLTYKNYLSKDLYDEIISKEKL